MKLKQYDHLPEGLLERPASSLYKQLDGPTLIHIPGKIEQPLLISVLQHGNENTGWEAARRLLKSYSHGQQLPRSISLLIGNIQAARFNRRRLDEQLDYNRCWPTGKPGEDKSELHLIFRQVLEIMRAKKPFAAVDIHNNTGQNPHYAAINRLDKQFFHLAKLFSDTVVYFTIPEGVFSNAFANICPAVTLECGLAGNIHGTDHSISYLETLLQLSSIPNTPLSSADIGLFHMVATVKVAAGLEIGFDCKQCDLELAADLDHLNFTELASNTSFGRVRNGLSHPLVTTDMHGMDVSDRYFRIQANQIRTTRPVMPSMLTMNERIIRQDCLCYLMERMDPAMRSNRKDEPLPEPTGLEGAGIKTI